MRPREPSHPLLRAVRESVAVLARRVVLDHGAVLHHEVRVALDEGVGRVVLNLVNDRLELRVDLVVGAIKGKLGDPDGLVERGMDVKQVAEERVGVDAVDMDIDEVHDTLVGAGGEELLQVPDTVVGGRRW